MAPGEAAEHLAAADVIVRYAACLDDRELGDAFRACFAPDVVSSGFGPAPVHGVDAWVAFVERALEPFTATQHLLGPPLVRIAGEEAQLRTELQAQHFHREPAGRLLTLWGTYRTGLVRTRGGWRIHRHHLDVRATRTHDPSRQPSASTIPS